MRIAGDRRRIYLQENNKEKNSATKARRHKKRNINFNVPLIETGINRIILVPKVLLTRRSKMGKTVVIDTDECIGCESCIELCSEVFAFNEEEEKAEVIMPEGGPEDCIEEAMDTCPVECIDWEED
jgi:ferredoxin